MRRRLASIAALPPATSSRTRVLMRASSSTLPDPVDDDLDRGDLQAGEALDLVGDLRPDGRRHLGEVQAVGDDDVHLDAKRLGLALDADPLAAQDAPDAGAGGEPDDAVAAECPLGHDLGDGVARDRQPATLEVQEEIIRHGSELDRRRRAEGCGRAQPASPGGSRPVALNRFGDFVALEAASADVRAGRRALEEHTDPLEVGVEAALRGHHRVRAMVAEAGLLPTDCADLAHRGRQCSACRASEPAQGPYPGRYCFALALSRAKRSAISSAVRTVSAALWIRSSACSTVSTVRTPKATGTPVSIPASCSPEAHSEAT